MNIKQLEEFRVLIDDVVYATSKNEAKLPIKKLEFFVTHLKGVVDPYFHGVMKTIVNHAKEASGQPRNKEHWLTNVEDNWNYLKMELELE